MQLCGRSTEGSASGSQGCEVRGSKFLRYPPTKQRPSHEKTTDDIAAVCCPPPSPGAHNCGGGGGQSEAGVQS